MGQELVELPVWFTFVATLTGASAGAMYAVRAKYDLFGTVTIAFVSGLGGGITRDVLLQNDGIFAFQNPYLLIATFIGGALVFYFGKIATYIDGLSIFLDNISVAFWALIGVTKSLSTGLNAVPAVILGTVTAVGGGILRAVLMNRVPTALLTGTLYGSAAFFGCALFAVMNAFNILPEYSVTISVALIIAIRYISLIFGWKTKPPHDYTDAVAHAVTAPVKYVAEKAGVNVDKPIIPDDKDSLRWKISHAWKVFSDRISGRWMEEDEATQGEKGHESSALQDHDTSHDKPEGGKSAGGKPEGEKPVDDKSEGGNPQS